MIPIPVEESKPKDNEIILCYVKGLKYPFVGRYYNDGWVDAITEHLEAESDYDYSGAEIVASFDKRGLTHWLPLPNPPEK